LLSVLAVAPGCYRTLGAFASEADQGPNDSAFLPGVDWLLSSGSLGVKVWDVASARLLRLLEIGDTYSARADPRGRGFYTAGAAGVFWWPLAWRRSEAGRLLEARFGPPEAIHDEDAVRAILDVTPDGELLAFGHQMHAHVYRTGVRTEIYRTPDRATIVHAAISPDGRWLACGNWNDKDVHIHDLTKGNQAASLPAFGSANGYFTPDGSHVVVAASDQYVFYAVGDWAPRRRLERGANNMLGDLKFSSDGKIFALPHSRRELRLHDAITAEVLLGLSTPDEEPLDSGLGLSSDRRWLVACSRMTRRVHVWDLTGLARGLEERGIAQDLPPIHGRPGDREDPEAGTPAVNLEVDLGILAPSRWQERELARWTSVIRAQPTHRLAHERRAGLHYILGRHEAALADRERSLELEPEAAEAMNNLAWQHVLAPPALRDAERAVELARGAVARAPTQKSYLNTLAGALVRAGKHEEALGVLGGGAILPGGAHGLDLLFLAMAQHHLGKPGAAREAFRRAGEWRRSQKGLHYVLEAELTALEAEVAALLGEGS
jgi:tetratricopeptide (TPR) repeat protein